MNTQGSGQRHTNRNGRSAGVIAVALVCLCGLPEGFASAQDQPSRPSRARDTQQRVQPGQDNNEQLTERQRQLIQAREAQQRATEQAANPPSVSAEGRPGQPARNVAQPGAGSSVGSLIDDNGEISINFAGPVELSAFLDYVSRALGLTVRSVTIPSSTVTFYAPVKIPVDQLLPLTRSILEDNNLSLVFDDASSTYVVRQSSAIPVGSETTRIFPTPMLSPSALQATIVQQLGQSAGVAGTRFTALDDLGVLIVTATPRTLDTVQRLIDDLTDLNNNQQLFGFDVMQVSATYARDRILTLVGEGVLGNQAGGVPRVTQAPGATGGSAGSFSNLGSRLFIGNGNQLILRGTALEADMLVELVDLVDEIRSLRVKRYLIGSAASQVARSGTELGLGPVTEISVGAGGSSFPTGGSRGFGSGQGTSDPGASGQPSASQFVLDTETGSFIYYGTEAQHERIEELVDEFKKTDLGDTIEIKIYKLRYASVIPPDGIEGDGVADILQALIEDPGQGTTNSPFLPGGRGGSTGALGGISQADLAALAAQNPDGVAGLGDALGGGNDGAGTTGPGDGTRLIATTENTTIVADQVRNQIIIKAPAKAQAQFRRIIEQLDTRQAQVFLEIQIVSVLANDDFSFSADVQINSGQFSFLSSFGLTSPAASGDPFDARTLGLGNAGVTAAVINSDFLPVAINALKTVGETRTLSVPQLLVNDNQLATYTSTTEVPFAATVTGNATTTTSQGGVAQAGTIINVRPRVSTGGYVTLEELSIELSSFTGEATGNLQPPSQNDVYTSVVTLPSDSTIVVGGFRLNIDSETTRKVPILGDIPLLGLLFRDIGEQTNNTTVFFFITPRIINDTRSSDMRLITQGPMEELGIDGDVPPLEFVSVPVSGRMPVRRGLPRNDAADTLLGETESTSE